MPDNTGGAARRLLDEASTIVLNSELTDDEIAEAQRLYPEETFERGIGEQLIAAPDLESRYRNGFHSDRVANRVGWALVRAAIDWRRVGMFRAITEAELVGLSRTYLPPRGRAAQPDETGWADALQWALQAPDNAPVALLEEERSYDEARLFRPFDYIVSYVDRYADQPLDGISGEIVDDVWEFALERSDGFEKTQVALIAEQRRREDVAEQAFSGAQEDAEPTVKLFAAFLHGANLSERGDVEGALAAYGQALDGGEGDPTITALTQFTRATKFGELGDQAGAEQAYRAAMAPEVPFTTLLSAVALGSMLQNKGDLVGARAVYLKAMVVSLDHRETTTQHSTLLAQLAHDHGVLMAKLSESKAAESAFRVAIPMGAGQVRASAEMRLGQLLRDRGEPGDLDEAVTLFRSAQRSDDKKVAAGAGMYLGMMLEDDDRPAAEAAYRQAAAAGDPGISQLAWLSLGTMLDHGGELAGAASAYEQAMVPDGPSAAMAAFNLGKLRKREGNRPAARDAYRVAARFTDSEPGQEALFELANTLMDLDETDEAVSVARQAIRTGHPDAMPRAAVLLGVLLQKRGDLAGAEAAYRQAVATGHPASAAAAHFNLGRLAESRRDPNAALIAYRAAIDSADRDASPMAAYNAGVLLARMGQLGPARALLRTAAASGHPQVAQIAAEALRTLPEH